MPTNQDTARAGIYQIRCLTNSKVYIGSSKHIGNRWIEHRKSLKDGTHHSITLLRAWRKYGAEQFVFEVIELVDNEGDLVQSEQAWLDRVRPFDKDKGYNISPSAESCRGITRSPETRRRISEAKKSSGWSPSLEHREAIGRAAKARVYGPEERAAMSAARKGKKRPPHVGERVRAALKGRPLSDEHRAKLSAAKIGTRLSEATKAKLARINTGRKHSPETRAKMKAIKGAIVWTPEMRQKHREVVVAAYDKKLAARRNPVVRREDAVSPKHPRAKVFREDADRIRELWSQGYTLDAIGKAYGVSPATIHRALKRNEWHGDYKGSGNPRSKLNKEVADEMRRMYSEGMSQQKIADRFSVGQSSVSRVIRGELWS